MLGIAIGVALLPVTIFLVILIVFDSFKLVPTSMLVLSILAGVAAAIVAWGINAWLFSMSSLPAIDVTRYVAPVTEETLKAAFVLYALKRRQIGFLVDAAIVGFAIGTGFAIVENVDYLRVLPDSRIWIWIVRGFGTAILHAMTTAIVAITAKSLADRYPNRAAVATVLPGLAIAVLLHSAFNHALVSPLLSAALLMLVLPLVVAFVFARSERMTREWVGDGLDLDVELLRLVRSTEFGHTRLGRYLHELRSRFAGPIVADMFCLLQLDLELSIRAKGMLMAREAGLDVPVDDQLRDQLTERAYLERAIGPTALRALRPLQVTSGRDQWHQYLLQHAGTGKRWWSTRT